MYSPSFDFRFCELEYEFEPINSWNPLPCDTQSQSSLYQTKHQFQKLSDFLLVTDQIHAMVRLDTERPKLTPITFLHYNNFGLLCVNLGPKVYTGRILKLCLDNTGSVTKFHKECFKECATS